MIKTVNSGVVNGASCRSSRILVAKATQLGKQASPGKNSTRQQGSHDWRAVAASVILPLVLAQPSLAAYPNIDTLFKVECGACHTNGGNILGGPTLRMKDLQKNGLAADKDKLQKVIALGYGRMPGFSADCTRSKVYCPVREPLTPDEITSVAEYILEKAEVEW